MILLIKRLSREIIFALIALLTACSKDNVIQPAELLAINDQVKLQTLWSVDSGKSSEKGYWTLRPAVVEDRVFVSDQLATVSAYSLDRGKLLWRNRLKSPASSGVFADSQHVYVGLRNGQLLALNADTGVESWRQMLSSQMLAPVASLSDYVIAQTVDGHVHALDGPTGKILWRFESVLPVLTLWGTSAPVIDSGLVLVGFANGKLVALELTTGRLVWERWIGIPKGRSEFERLVDLDGQFLVQNETLYVVGYRSRIAAMSLPQGQPLWARDMSSYVALATDPQSLFVAEADGSITALSLDGGKVRWQNKSLAARQLSGLAIVQGQLLVGDLEGYLHVLSADEGEFVGRARIASAPIRVAPVVVDDKLVVHASDARLKALRLKILKK